MPAPPDMDDLPTGRARRHPHLDAHRIAPKLWVGAYPHRLPRYALRNYQFDLLVVCSNTAVPPNRWPGVEVVNVSIPMLAVPSATEWHDVVRAAWRIAAAHRLGRRIVVTCPDGRDRGTLVAATALRLISPRATPERIAEIVGHRRPSAWTLVEIRLAFQARAANLPLASVNDGA